MTRPDWDTVWTQEPAPVARRGASNWSKREDSTWIDKL